MDFAKAIIATRNGALGVKALNATAYLTKHVYTGRMVQSTSRAFQLVYLSIALYCLSLSFAGLNDEFDSHVRSNFYVGALIDVKNTAKVGDGIEQLVLSYIRFAWALEGHNASDGDKAMLVQQARALYDMAKAAEEEHMDVDDFDVDMEDLFEDLDESEQDWEGSSDEGSVERSS